MARRARRRCGGPEPRRHARHASDGREALVIPRALRAPAWAAGAVAVGAGHSSRRASDATASQAARSCADATDGGSVSIHVEVQRSNEAYPVNRLRNIGLRSVNTSHVLVSDADFLPSRGLRDAIRAKAHWLANEKLALVVPAFQRKGGRCKTPRRSHASSRSHDCAGLLRPARALFAREGLFSFPGHQPPVARDRSSRWLEGDETVRPTECFRSVRHEPHVVVSMAQMPLYDERFVVRKK